MKIFKITSLLFITLALFNCSSDNSSQGNQNIIDENYCKLYKIDTNLGGSSRSFLFDYTTPNEIHIEGLPSFYGQSKIILKFENQILKEKQKLTKNDNDDFVLSTRTTYTSNNSKITNAQFYNYHDDETFVLEKTFVYTYDLEGRIVSESIDNYLNEEIMYEVINIFEWTANNITKISTSEILHNELILPNFDSIITIIEYDLNNQNLLNKAVPYAMFFMNDLYHCYHEKFEYMSNNPIKTIHSTTIYNNQISEESSYELNYTYDNTGYFKSLEGWCLKSNFYWNCNN